MCFYLTALHLNLTILSLHHRSQNCEEKSPNCKIKCHEKNNNWIVRCKLKFQWKKSEFWVYISQFQLFYVLSHNSAFISHNSEFISQKSELWGKKVIITVGKTKTTVRCKLKIQWKKVWNARCTLRIQKYKRKKVRILSLSCNSKVISCNTDFQNV